jgi:excisionase family DNA binding protein
MRTLPVADSEIHAAALDPDQLYRVEIAASKLGISRAKAFQMIRSGELGSIKLRGSRRVPGWAIQRITRVGFGSDAA